MPARSACLNCLASLAGSSTFSTASPAERSSAASPSASGSSASSSNGMSTCTVDGSSSTRPFSMSCQNRRERPMDMPTPGREDFVYCPARFSYRPPEQIDPSSGCSSKKVS